MTNKTSKLDEILLDLEGHFAVPDSMYQEAHAEAKHQLLDLFEQLGLEVIGEDIITHRSWCDLSATYSSDQTHEITCTCDITTTNDLKDWQRTRLEKLIKEMKENKNSQATRSKPGR